MPIQSTAKYVSYDLRPAKQCERKMMLDSFFAAAESGFSIPDYRYVGMGANRFYDFILLHRYFAIKNMISLEHDPAMFRRAQYSCPYGFIDIRNVTAAAFFGSDDYDGNTIYWMDYDRTISSEIVDDINSLAPSLKIGDFLFVTVCAIPPGPLQKLGAKRRLTELRNHFGDMATSITTADVTDKCFSDGAHKILCAAFSSAFAFIPTGLFLPFFSVEYADGTTMITHGGVLTQEDQRQEFVDRLVAKVPVLGTDGRDRYRIRKFDLTEKERSLFDLAVTSDREDSPELRKIRALGFRNGELESYRELLRYYPRYVETVV